MTYDEKLNQLARLYHRYATDFEAFARDQLVVRDHNTASLVPFQFNNGQKILHAVAEKQRKTKGYVRIIFLKARRFGGSTYVEGRFYWLTSLRPNRSTFIVGHEQDSTDTLYQMARLFHERNEIPPATKRSNMKELVFDTEDGREGLKSAYRLANAMNLDAGRSQGIHYLHGSECAYWRDGAALLSSLLTCVPDPPSESEIFLESTANGYGNRFQADVFAAYSEGAHPYMTIDGIPYAWSNPDTDWILVFIPWFAHGLYTLEFDTPEARDAFEVEISRPAFDRASLTWGLSEDRKLQDHFKLTLEQLHWRRWAIANKCNGSLDIFRQEYPSTVEEAFLTRGSNIFGKVLCDMLEENTREPALVGNLVDRMGVTKVRPDPNGYFRLWEKPSKLGTYVVTCDPGGGVKKSQEDENREPDPTSIDVWNHRTGVQCAQWHGHIDYGMIADLVEMVGNLYFRCPACVELMNHGYTVVNDLRKRQYPMYEAKPGEPGYLTNSKTKPVMIDDLATFAQDGNLQVRCRETVMEMRTFIEKNGKYGAESGCHDDRVISAALGGQMLKLLPKMLSPAEQEKRLGRQRDTSIGNYPVEHDRKPVKEPREREKDPEVTLGTWNSKTPEKRTDEVRITFTR